jgi:hypothetical protein
MADQTSTAVITNPGPGIKPPRNRMRVRSGPIPATIKITTTTTTIASKVNRAEGSLDDETEMDRNISLHLPPNAPYETVNPNTSAPNAA